MGRGVFVPVPFSRRCIAEFPRVTTLWSWVISFKQEIDSNDPRVPCLDRNLYLNNRIEKG
jgi:hypothetical protein